jgi:Na+/phosphate symporter
VVAEEQGHHPDLHLTGFNTVVAEMTTHAAKGLTENDFIMASKVGDLLLSPIGFAACALLDRNAGSRLAALMLSAHVVLCAARHPAAAAFAGLVVCLLVLPTCCLMCSSNMLRGAAAGAVADQPD